MKIKKKHRRNAMVIGGLLAVSLLSVGFSSFVIPGVGISTDSNNIEVDVGDVSEFIPGLYSTGTFGFEYFKDESNVYTVTSSKVGVYVDFDRAPFNTYIENLKQHNNYSKQLVFTMRTTTANYFSNMELPDGAYICFEKESEITYKSITFTSISSYEIESRFTVLSLYEYDLCDFLNRFEMSTLTNIKLRLYFEFSNVSQTFFTSNYHTSLVTLKYNFEAI